MVTTEASQVLYAQSSTNKATKILVSYQAQQSTEYYKVFMTLDTATSRRSGTSNSVRLWQCYLGYFLTQLKYSQPTILWVLLADILLVESCIRINTACNQITPKA